MNLIKLIIESHKNINYELNKIKQKIDTYRQQEELMVCVCDIYVHILTMVHVEIVGNMLGKPIRKS